MKNRTLIVVPIYNKDVIEPQLITSLATLTQVGTLLVISQGIKPVLRHDDIIHIHLSSPLGIWGAAREVFKLIGASCAGESLIISGQPFVIPDVGDITCIVHNFSPLYFSSMHTERVQGEILNRHGVHTVGRRQDIASSLSAEPAIGVARALVECYYTYLAGLILGKDGHLIKDGFSGLQAFSILHYLGFNLDWVDRTTFGGTLEVQRQTIVKGKYISHIEVPHTTARTWGSTSGADMNVVKGTLDKIRKLPLFENVPKNMEEKALNEFGHAFSAQPWILDPHQASEEMRTILRDYEREKLA